MWVTILLGGIGALFLTAAALVPWCRSAAAPPIGYGASLLICALGLVGSLSALISGGEPVVRSLPLGIPWIEVQFRLDTLAAFFLAVVNLGGAAASLYAVGYGRHESAPQRVLPFFPAFLAAMNLVVLADDAFTFLFAWELM